MSSLDDFARLSGKLYVDGQWVASTSTNQFDVIEPATEDRLGRIADATDAEIDQAIDIANRARKVWCKQDPRSRAVILHDIAAVIRRDKALYAECTDAGRRQAVQGIRRRDFLVRHRHRLLRRTCAPRDRPHRRRHRARPVPFQRSRNRSAPSSSCCRSTFPLVLLCWEASAALAAGNAVIVKPHEQTSLTTLKFMELVSDPTGPASCRS